MRARAGTTLWLVALLLACESFDPPTAPRGLALSDCDPPPPTGADSFPAPIMDGAGLYGGFSNTPPAFHHDAGLVAASQVPETGALIVSLGMSITREAFEGWRSIANTDAMMVNAACGGCTSSAWTREGARGWLNAEIVFDSLGIPMSDVDVVWMSVTRWQASNATPTEMEDILLQIRAHYPNVKQVFVTNRTYGGWRDPSAEPAAWEDGRTVRSFVLNHLAETEPWIGWGGDVWANGDTPRSDGLTWPRSDFKADGLHYKPWAIAKLGAIVNAQFEASPYTAWYQW